MDKAKPPGHTSYDGVYPLPEKLGTLKGCLGWLLGYLNPWNFLVNSPNAIWLLVALADYVFTFPDEAELMAGCKTWSRDWIAVRVATNTVIMLGYFGFFSICLYVLGFGSRKFDKDHVAGPSRMFHNVWYCLLGAAQLGIWEACFMWLYANERIEFVKDSELWSSNANIARTIGWTLFVPVWRSTHFYFAHRFIHIRVLYKYVHSLHHRNTDIEPFAGLCMHPVEHLFYFSCIGPSLCFKMSPFHMVWNAVHLLISPAASHSGWEDNFQSGT